MYGKKPFQTICYGTGAPALSLGVKTGVADGARCLGLVELYAVVGAWPHLGSPEGVPLWINVDRVAIPGVVATCRHMKMEGREATHYHVFKKLGCE